MFTIVGNKIREDATDSGIDFVYGLPNKQALPMWEKKANFQVIQNLHVRVMIFPVNIRSPGSKVKAVERCSTKV